ncbi:lipase/esterase [hydrocarbon metagenome]|uniref:Lipase/esterase n=1 Tax=hydrocarbon metagenome TaxID=938273 RepID=A0A0W8E5M1_9ZZZZ
MASFQSKMFRFMLKNRHLLKGHIKKPVIDFNTSIEELREEVRKDAAKMTKMPDGITINPADFPGFYAEWVIPQNCREDQAILYFHGSGFVMGTSKDHRGLVAKFASRCGVKALVFDYSLAPEHPFPAAINDSVAVYKWMLEIGYQPQNIIFAGDSAGGCIAFSTLLILKDENIPLPQAVVAFSPCTDLTCSGESHKTKAKIDPATPEGATATYTSYYIGNSDPTSPYMSPLYGDLAGLPPVMIQVGEDETLLDDSVRFAQKAKEAGVEVHLHVWEGMFHCFPLLAPMFPEATRAMDEVCEFIHR